MSIISWNKVFKAFGETKVLVDMNLEVNEGETLTIIGGSGSGKSVMLRLLLALMHPDSGKVYFDGHDVTIADEEGIIEIRKQVGMLFQGGALFDSLSVAENIAYPLREHYDYSEEHIAKIVAEKLDLVGLPGTQNIMPSDLSGGMKKRVALARAIATDPKVILYDEPTTGLDPANTMRINKLIRHLQNKLKVTSIVVTHDMSSAFYVSDRLAMLYDRKIEYVGTADEVRRSTNRIVQNFINGEIGDG